jgi:hypothetical protein
MTSVVTTAAGLLLSAAAVWPTSPLLALVPAGFLVALGLLTDDRDGL